MKLLGTTIIFLLGVTLTFSKFTTKDDLEGERREIIPALRKRTKIEPVVSSANVPKSPTEHSSDQAKRGEMSNYIPSTSNGPLVPNTLKPEEMSSTVMSTPQEDNDRVETHTNQISSTLSQVSESSNAEISSNHTTSPTNESTDKEESASGNTQNSLTTVTSGNTNSFMSITNKPLVDDRMDKMESDMLTSTGHILIQSTTSVPVNLDVSPTGNPSNQILSSQNELGSVSATLSDQGISNKAFVSDQTLKHSFTSTPSQNGIPRSTTSLMEETSNPDTNVYTIRLVSTVSSNMSASQTNAPERPSTTSMDLSVTGTSISPSSQSTTTRNDDLGQDISVSRKPSDVSNAPLSTVDLKPGDNSELATSISIEKSATSTSPVPMLSNPTNGPSISSESSRVIERTSQNNSPASPVSGKITTSTNKVEKSETSTKIESLDPIEQLSEMRSNPAELQPDTLWPPVPTASSVMPTVSNLLDTFTTAAADQGLPQNYMDFNKHNSI